jgi:hypothetical protein
MLATQEGERPAGDLTPGDRLRTADGWVTISLLTQSATPVPSRADVPQPGGVHFLAGSLAPGLPEADLILHPTQRVRLSGTGGFERAADLVNGATILREDSVEFVWIGLRFDASSHPSLWGMQMGGLAPPDPAAFSEVARAELAARHAGFSLPSPMNGTVRHHLSARARALGHPMGHDPALRLRLNGRDISPRGAIGHVCRFTLDEPEAEIRLVSRAIVPAEARMSPDQRRLGIAVSRILLDGADVSLDHWSLRDGWHEPEASWRWTDGSARFLLPAGTRDVEIVVANILTRYPFDA